jgi:hypothetical protein
MCFEFGAIPRAADGEVDHGKMLTNMEREIGNNRGQQERNNII